MFRQPTTGEGVMINVKTWQLWMHCNLRPPEPRQSFTASITTPCQVWRRWTYSLPCYSVFYADTLLYTVTLTFDLWPWTFAAYRLWRDETLCQIWTQSNNLRRCYCDFSVWPYDLEHVLSVALGSGIIFTKFDLRQLINACIVAFLCWYVVSGRDVDLWPWKLVVVHQVSLRVSCV